MLVLTLTPEDDYIQIGPEIRISLMACPGGYIPRKIRLKIDAPQHVNIVRRKVLEKLDYKPRKEIINGM